MRTHLYKYLVIGLLAITTSSTTALAQNIDANRMNRDIRIMENILAEMFRITITSSNSNRSFTIADGSFGRRGAIRGTYLSDFGIIFMVPSDNLLSSRLSQGDGSGFSFYYSNEEDDGDYEVTQESVISRVSDFLKNYASTIGQLSDEENILIIYGPRTDFDRILSVSQTGGGVSTNRMESLPVISISATVKDLSDYRSGRLNEQQFQERLTLHIDEEEKEYIDLNVMSNIFDSAFESSEGERFQITGRVNHLMLANFGAIFNFDIRYSSGNARMAYFPGGSVISYQGRTFDVRGNGVSVDNDDSDSDEDREEFIESLNSAFSNFKILTSEYIVDYGRTLSSVSSDQMILTTANINGRYEGIPERVDFQIKKSVLEDYDRGRLSREEALEQVVITEY